MLPLGASVVPSSITWCYQDAAVAVDARSSSIPHPMWVAAMPSLPQHSNLLPKSLVSHLEKTCVKHNSEPIPATNFNKNSAGKQALLLVLSSNACKLLPQTSFGLKSCLQTNKGTLSQASDPNMEPKHIPGAQAQLLGRLARQRLKLQWHRPHCFEGAPLTNQCKLHWYDAHGAITTLNELVITWKSLPSLASVCLAFRTWHSPWRFFSIDILRLHIQEESVQFFPSVHPLYFFHFGFWYIGSFGQWQSHDCCPRNGLSSGRIRRLWNSKGGSSVQRCHALREISQTIQKKDSYEVKQLQLSKTVQYFLKCEEIHAATNPHWVDCFVSNPNPALKKFPESQTACKILEAPRHLTPPRGPKNASLQVPSAIISPWPLHVH